MSLFQQTIDIPKRFKKYITDIKKLLEEYEITSFRVLVKRMQNSEFKKRWKNIWKDLIKNEGGKISLTTMGIIIGSSLGGVGIASMGGAIGVPLALVLGLGGYIVGAEIDDNSRKNKSIEQLKLNELFVIIKRIEEILGQYSAYIIDLESNIKEIDKQFSQIKQEIEKAKEDQGKLVDEIEKMKKLTIFAIIVFTIVALAATLISIFT